MKIRSIFIPTMKLSQCYGSHAQVIKDNLAAIVDVQMKQGVDDCCIVFCQQRMENGDYQMLFCGPYLDIGETFDAVHVDISPMQFPPIIFDNGKSGIMGIIERVWDKLMALK